jgi:hypothetical protein
MTASLTRFLLLVLVLIGSAYSANSQQLAFPTAEGFGRFSTGGRGGKAYNINSLSADSGAGGSCNAGGCGGGAPFSAGTVTFRDCLQDRFGVGARTCIFRVGGQIDFTYCSRCYTMTPFITIAGQTAPGNGIMLRNFEMGVYGDVNLQHDVIVRHVRIRNHNYNDTSRCNNELVSIVYNAYNVIADHVSGGWNFRSAYSAAYGIKGITFQWMLLSEGATAAPACSNDPSPTPLSLAGLSTLGGDQNNGVSYLHGYISGYGDRIPVNSSTLTVQIVNQVAYNTYGGGWVQTSTTAGSNQPPFVEYINNYYQPGAGGLDVNEPRLFLGAGLTNQPPTDNWAAQSQIYLSGNIHTLLRPNLTQPESNFALQYDWGDPAHAVPLNITTTRYAAMPAIPSTVSAAQAKQDVFDRKYGAYGKLPQGYDTIDARAVRALQNNSGGTTTATSTATACSDGECGETGTYPVGTPPIDTDGDGIPDSWETGHGLNPNDPADGPVITANGYSNLENYLNELAGDVAPVPLLVAHYPLDSSGADTSGNNNPLTLAGSPSFGGGALVLDGATQYGSAANAAILNPASGFTFFAQVNPSQALSGLHAVVIKNYALFLYASSGYCSPGGILIGFTNTSGTTYTACRAENLPLNTWTALAGTYNGSTLTLYVNGVAVSTAPASGTVATSTGTLQVGASQYGEYFPGGLDDVRVYNAALSAADIQALSPLKSRTARHKRVVP